MITIGSSPQPVSSVLRTYPYTSVPIRIKFAFPNTGTISSFISHLSSFSKR